MILIDARTAAPCRSMRRRGRRPPLLRLDHGRGADRGQRRDHLLQQRHAAGADDAEARAGALRPSRPRGRRRACRARRRALARRRVPPDSPISSFMKSTTRIVRRGARPSAADDARRVHARWRSRPRRRWRRCRDPTSRGARRAARSRRLARAPAPRRRRWPTRPRRRICGVSTSLHAHLAAGAQQAMDQIGVLDAQRRRRNLRRRVVVAHAAGVRQAIARPCPPSAPAPPPRPLRRRHGAAAAQGRRRVRIPRSVRPRCIVGGLKSTILPRAPSPSALSSSNVATSTTSAVMPSGPGRHARPQRHQVQRLRRRRRPSRRSAAPRIQCGTRTGSVCTFLSPSAPHLLDAPT